MTLKLSYKYRILLYFSLIIAAFTFGIIMFERQQVKNERTGSLERMLDTDADIMHTYIQSNELLKNNNMDKLDDLLQYMSSALRVTIIDEQGVVLFDNRLEAEALENHLQRPEVQKAVAFKVGSNIRQSASNNQKYLYYAKKYSDGYFVRVALPYNIQIQTFINSRNSFIYYILLFFLVCVGMMLYFANLFSKSISSLREFSHNLQKGRAIPLPSSVFPDDEVGEISSVITQNYNLLQENKRNLSKEREKLLLHFQYSEEGIAIFSKDFKKIYANAHFLQYLNVIIDTPTLEIESIFTDENFKDFEDFLNDASRKENMFTKRIDKNGKQFNMRLLIFDDESFEMYISDITKSEKTRLLKQEMTNNIAHELRTPVTSIRGYLETLQTLDAKDEVRRSSFLERAYLQSIRLSELIQDISMLTKIEEASDRFQREPVEMQELLMELGADLSEKFKEKKIRYSIQVNEDVIIYGSRTLLYSIFRNLTENSIMYAGENIDIVTRCYLEDSETYYFEYYDTGVGVDEKHMVRIFERFYRVNEGRTRNTGGSGLGLSIVKNAVLFHQGSIIAKNRAEGGLSFMITLPKTTDKSRSNEV